MNGATALDQTAGERAPEVVRREPWSARLRRALAFRNTAALYLLARFFSWTLVLVLVAAGQISVITQALVRKFLRAEAAADRCRGVTREVFLHRRVAEAQRGAARLEAH